MKKPLGFSLLELMVILAIMGILVSLALPAYNNHFKRSKFTEVIIMTQALQRVIEICFYNHSSLDNCSSFEKVARKETDFTDSSYVADIEIANNTNFTITATATEEASIGTSDTYIMQATINGNQLVWRLSPSSTCISAGTC
ncbi:prepilin-type N-terminal cleavage/methylation domain-containing protein [Pseudoalteromonas mariniglutinosa]|uniref:pilin n=1 Tax=Pseudoalteromonas mariniglutinosa TaxID=206042 RepID=UPI00384BAA08